MGTFDIPDKGVGKECRPLRVLVVCFCCCWASPGVLLLALVGSWVALVAGLLRSFAGLHKGARPQPPKVEKSRDLDFRGLLPVFWTRMQ